MTEMTAEIQKAIKENLSGAVAGELKDFIEVANATAIKYKDVIRDNDHLSKENSRLKNLELRQEDVAKREKKVSARENDIKHKDEIMTLKESHAKVRVNEIRELTNTVFRSNRMNYNVDVSVPMFKPVDNSGYDHGQMPTHETVTGTVTKEE